MCCRDQLQASQHVAPTPNRQPTSLPLIYLTTTWLKWGGGAWKDGTATFYAAHLGEFKRFPVPASS